MELAKRSVEYYPTYSGDTFTDNLSDITAKMFKELGVICPCTKRKYINKYTFIHNHCKSQTHQDFIDKLNNNKSDIIELSVKRKNEIKTLKIMVGKANQEIHNLKRYLEEFNKIKEENEELKIQLESLEEHLKRESKLYSDRMNMVEEFSKQFLSQRGYEIND